MSDDPTNSVKALKECGLSPCSPHRVTITQHACTYNTVQCEYKQINLTHTKKSKHSK